MKPIRSIPFAQRSTIDRRQSARLALCCLALALSANTNAFAATHNHHHESRVLVKSPPGARPSGSESPTQPLPPVPAGVTELKFGEFFVSPVGPRGLELTEKLRGLEGQRVRILGYMAHRDVQLPGMFLLTPFPVQVHDHDNSLAEDSPASVVQVSVPTLRDQQVPYAPGLMLLTGTLTIGNHPDPDGRVSLVRLELDPPPTTTKGKTRGDGKNSVKGAQRLMK